MGRGRQHKTGWSHPALAAEQSQPAPAVPAQRAPIPVEEVRYMVWREGGGMPTVTHDDWGAANSAARHLSRANPADRFHVLKTVRIYKKGERQP